MIQTTSIASRDRTYKLTSLSLYESSTGLDIFQCTQDFIDDSLKGVTYEWLHGFTEADLPEVRLWMMRPYPKEASSIVSLTPGSGNLRFLSFSVGGSLCERSFKNFTFCYNLL